MDNGGAGLSHRDSGDDAGQYGVYMVGEMIHNWQQPDKADFWIAIALLLILPPVLLAVVAGRGVKAAFARFLCLIGLHIPTLDGRSCQTCRKSMEPEGRVMVVRDPENFVDEVIERGKRG